METAGLKISRYFSVLSDGPAHSVFGDDFGDRQSVDPPMSDEYVAHFGSVDAELSGPRMFGPPMSDEYVAHLGQSKPGPGY